MRPEERTWLAQPPRNPRPAEVVLYLGCNVLRTAHMVRTVIDVFRLLGVDFIAVGGAAYCCGAPYRSEGAGAARQVGERSAGYFARFQPQRVVMWCPGCIYYYQDALGLDFPYPIQHVSKFLTERMKQLPLARMAAQRVALHYHTGRPQTQREATAAVRLLMAVPGLDLVELGTDPRLSRQCNGAVVQDLGGKGWETIITGQMERAADQGVNVLATLYHGCHRLLAAYQERYPFVVEHYLSVVGRSLGLEHEDIYRKYLLWGDADRILEDAAPCLAANGVPPQTARPLVQRTFVERQPG